MIQVSMPEWVVLSFIRSFKDLCGYPPSVLEITHRCRIRSRYATYRLLKRLERKGALSLGGSRRGRTIVLPRNAIGVMP